MHASLVLKAVPLFDKGYYNFFFFFLSITSLRQVIYLKEIKKIMKHLPMYILVAFVGGVEVEPIKREVSKFVYT